MIDPDIRLAILRNLADLGPGDAVGVGVSGGADSVALLRAAVHVAAEHEWQVHAIVIDHGLQTRSHEIAEEAGRLCVALGAHEVTVLRVEVRQGGGGLEAAARAARRLAFESVAAQLGLVAVLLGHTRDDQAETVLLGLARGSGARSLSGMRAHDGLYRRPLLTVARAAVRASVADLAVHDDPHNDDTRFARVRVRREVLPVLERELGPGVAESLARTADMLRDDADALDAVASANATSDAAELAVLPRAVRTRVLRTLALEAGCPANDLTRDHVLAVEALVTDWHGQGPINLPGGVNCARRGGTLLFATRDR